MGRWLIQMTKNTVLLDVRNLGEITIVHPKGKMQHSHQYSDSRVQKRVGDDVTATISRAVRPPCQVSM